MKYPIEKILISALATILFVGANACSVSAAPATNGITNGVSYATTLPIDTVSELTEEETEALLYMREEEKLARDVYNVMYELWGQPIFQNIATSEQNHMDAVKLLLDRYNLSDPVLGAGSFSDPNLQALYDQLIAQGSVSLSEALKVGAAIEEIDILDLEARLEKTNSTDIQMVFNNLAKGSYNHLRAFTRTLSRQTGETYEPGYLSPEAYATIITGQAGNGIGNGRQAQVPSRGGPRWSK